MAEGFEAYHVPQQSRRDRLRVFVQNHPSDSAAGLLPFVDHHSLIPSDFLLVSDAKEKGVNFMDPQLSSGVSFQEINGNPFLYSHQNFRFLDQSFNGGDVDVVYKQEPLSSLAAVPATNISNNNITTGQVMDPSLEAPLSDDPQYSCGDGSHELRRNKSKLISMLNEVPFIFLRFKIGCFC
uniref:Uncharacterized protein isoform X2 n=1 Tax=Nicotiana tabacum TaxID=4097 RepID=A0A1S4A9H6_TOBAC|nr:PREDICTED: uncharacterized protein LOC107795164 isoform X2 [Nicotiana tabacum]